LKTIEYYHQELKARGYHSDPAQLRAVERLQQCEDEWIAYNEIRSNNLKKRCLSLPYRKGFISGVALDVVNLFSWTVFMQPPQ
jgi:predicted ATPase